MLPDASDELHVIIRRWRIISNSLAQEEASTPGMWVFLSTEVLFFGGLFATY